MDKGSDGWEGVLDWGTMNDDESDGGGLDKSCAIVLSDGGGMLILGITLLVITWLL